MSVNARSMWLSFSRTRLGRSPHARLVAAIELARAVERLDRPRWLYRPAGVVPSGQFHFREPHEATDSALALCERLIAAYGRSISDGPADRRGMWTTDLFQHRHRELHAALVARDPADLARTLASMFRSDIVLGMAAGSMGHTERSRLGRRMFWLATLSRLTALAEAVGAARVENPEQGDLAVGIRQGLPAIVGSIEHALDTSLDFPDVGAAYGVLAADRLITPDSPDQVYAAYRLKAAIELHLPPAAQDPHVVEIGGGYGGMAYWFVKMRQGPYTLVDLPIVNVLQGYFLAEALGHDEVALYGEPAASVTVLPDHALDAVATPFAVLANKDSMPEIPRDALRTYLEWAKASCSGIFYSYNQESGAVFDGMAQAVVPHDLSEVGGFRRVRRDLSWLRRGYAEEIYLRDAG